MTKNGKTWIGDQVHDEEAQRDGIITDVRAGVYVLRTVYGAREWTTKNPGHLTIVVPRGKENR